MATINPQLLEGLDVLAAVVDTGSFWRAGDALGMSPSGVSRSITRLEARLGIRLFDRTTRSVRLTDEGRTFCERVFPLAEALAEATSSAADGAGTVRGRIRINVDPFFASLILGPKLGDFLDTYPELEVELRSRDELGDLVSDGFDLAVRFGHPQSSSLVARKLLETRVLTLASPAYLERFGHPSEPSELEGEGHRCILFRDSHTGRPFTWEFHQGQHKVNLKVRGALMVNDASTLYSSCLAGYGVAQLFELGAETFLAEGRLVTLFPEWVDEKFPLYAYYPSRHYLPAKTRAMLEFVTGLLQN